MRADRLVSLALLLQARGRVSAAGLAAELEVSVRTVYRDIAALNAAGVPVLAEPGPNGGCRLIDGYRFPLRGLSADEAEALLMLGVPAAAADLGLADALSDARRKVRTSAGAAAGPVLVHLDLPRWFAATEPVPQLRTLAAAVRLGQRLTFTYAPNGAGSARVRQVDPLGLVNKAGTWYLVAVRGTPGPGAPDPDPPPGGARADPVVYRAGRVSAARVLPAAAGRPAGFDLVAFWERWSAEFVGRLPRVEVLLRASPDALSVFPEVFGDLGRQAAEAAGPGPAGPTAAAGWRAVRLTFESERAAAHRLAGFGREVEVLAPEAVRVLLLGTARELLHRYAPDG
jgi:predicted DNA-binding transcriptional regulator YafY